MSISTGTATVSNYEYILMWTLDQAANIHCEVRATGIVSTMPVNDGIKLPWMTRVADGVGAAYHQHLPVPAVLSASEDTAPKANGTRSRPSSIVIAYTVFFLSYPSRLLRSPPRPSRRAFSPVLSPSKTQSSTNWDREHY